jgi:hypothetical protein
LRLQEHLAYARARASSRPAQVTGITPRP